MGLNFSCALLDNNTIKCWGDGFFGQLGQGDTTPRGDMPNQLGDALPGVELAPGLILNSLSCAGNHCCTSFINHAVKCWGQGSSGELGSEDTQYVGVSVDQMGDGLPFVDLGPLVGAVSVSAGQFSSCALLLDGGVKCWGANSAGELGIGNSQTRGDAPGTMGSALPKVNLGTTN